MINLIKNELKKIFSKKAIYIVLIITIGFCILSNIMQKRARETVYSYMNYNYESEEDIVIYEDNLEIAKENGDTEGIIILETKIEKIKIMENYDKRSWQQNFGEQLENTIESIKRATNEADKEKYQKEYDELVKNFKEDNWRACAERELEKINKEITEITDKEERLSKEDEKKVLEWRIEKNISYATSDLNTYLNTWRSERMNKRYTEKETYSNPADKEEQLQQYNATIEICEYAIENDLNTNISKQVRSSQGIISTTAKSQFLEVFDSYGFFIILTVVIIAGTIVSEEFNKGTIKLLLVRPYKRTKILLAKFITCLIILLGSYITLALTQTIVGGIVYGFNSYSDPTIMYNFTTNSIEHVGNIQYVIMSGLAILPQYLLLMALAFAIGTIATNSPIAIAIPCIGTFISEIINELAYHFEKARFLIYFVTPNWDLSIYAFGKKPLLPELSLPFSIIICAIYFAILLWASIMVFKRRDIKNI